jgi:hypothetical protein
MESVKINVDVQDRFNKLWCVFLKWFKNEKLCVYKICYFYHV